MEPGVTVLVVDDEPEIVELLRDFLMAAGFAVLTAGGSDEAMALLLSAPRVDVLVLDVLLPGRSGFEFCRQLRERPERHLRDLPVLFLSAHGSDSDKLRGLGLGGDDYIVKTASPSEVVARVQAVLRRISRSEQRVAPMLDFGALRIDLAAHEVQVEGRPVALTAREFELLRLLAEHPRQVFTREQLFTQCWGAYGDRHTVTVHIGRIREKIEPDPAQPRYIVTVWGIGYRFEGERR